MLVAEVLRNKDIRSTLAVKGKRAMTDKQKANLAKFRFKKKAITPEEDDSAVVRKPVEVAAPSKPNPKSKVKINPRAQNQVEQPLQSLKENVKQEVAEHKALAVETPTLPQPKQVGEDVKIVGSVKIMEDEFRDDFQKKRLLNTEYKFERRTRDRASLNAHKLHHQHTNADQLDQNGLPSHTKRLLRNLHTNNKVFLMRNKEHASSTNKTTDGQDRNVLNKVTEGNQKEREAADKIARGLETFEDLPEPEIDATDVVTKAKDIKRLSRVEQLQKLSKDLREGRITKAEFDTKLKEVVTKSNKELEGITKESEALKTEGKEVTSEEVNKKLLELLTRISNNIDRNVERIGGSVEKKKV